MNRYVIACAETGEILRCIICDSNQIEHQAQDGEVLDLHDEATSSTHFMTTTGLSAYSPEQQAAKQRRPSHEACWSNEEMVWLDLRQATEIHAQQLESIRGQRNALLLKSDSVVLRCYERGVPVPTDWALYRQALREFPARKPLCAEPVWPASPAPLT